MTRVAVGFTFVGLSLVGCSRKQDGLPRALQAALESAKPPEFVASGEEGSRLWKDLQRFYKRRAYEPAWVGQPGWASALAAEVAKAEAEGLDARAYDLGDSVAAADRKPAGGFLRREKQDFGQQATAELRLSHVFMRYGRHLLSGSVDPRALDKNWVGETRTADMPDLLERALSGQIGATLQGLRPRHPQYARLQQALARYRAMAPGDAAKATTLQGGGQLRTVATGQAAADPNAQQRIRTLELNLERWRWLPEELGERFVMVNIPAFRLQAFEGAAPALEMRVITGKTEDPTPILADQMTHVIFSPYWNIPPTIAREEWMPKLSQNPNYLAEHGVEVVKGSRVVDPSRVDWNDGDLRLRQRPGATNALGLVKFAFPNRYNVYLHDTPNDSAFHQASRDLSHGCVRVEKPLELAEWVLKGQSEWTREKIDAAMHAGTEKHVKLAKPIPVYLIYQTAWVDDDGQLKFLDDLYGHDAAQLALLKDGPA